MTDWTEKYRPETLAEVRGNNKARDALKKWADTWDDHREAVVLYGSPGVGKTSAAHALANDMGWNVMELNASDARTADVIERVAGEAARSGTLTAGDAGRRLVILDEADNLHGSADRGGAAAITSLVKEAGQPIILIANEYYEMTNGLRNAAQDIEFRDVSKRSIVPVLRDVCRKEGIDFEKAALEAIAEDTSGDLRSAVNDLQALAEADGELREEDVVTGERDTTKDIFEFLDELIKEKDAQGALQASYDVDETPDDLISWVDENVPKDYQGGELADAYEFISNADRWLGRVRATQNYSYWRYAGDNMTAGVAASRREPKGGWTRYSPPSYWSQLGRSRGRRNTRDHIAERIAEEHGVSVATARREIMPYLAAITHHCSNREATVGMAARYEMDAKHVSFVTGSGESTNKVQDIVEEARGHRGDVVEEGGGYFDAAPDEADAEAQGSEKADSERDESTDEGDEDDGQSGLGDFV